MSWLKRMGQDWRTQMNAADRLRVILAWGFVFGAISHIGWVVYHGDLWYYGPAPSWAPIFWYSVCIFDMIVFYFLLTRPRLGLIAAVATMTSTLIVNWTQFPTFEFGLNYVLIGLTLFGVLVFLATPWLWIRSTWSLR